MILSFKYLIGSVPNDGRTESEVKAAVVTVKKEERISLSTSDKLELSKTAQEGGGKTFAFFETNGKIDGDFEIAYNLHMRLESLNKASLFYDMKYVFNIIRRTFKKLVKT